MRSFKEYLQIEASDLTRRKIMVMALLFFILSQYFVQNGIVMYKNLLLDVQDFKVTENLEIANYVNYQDYGHFGFKIKYIPPPLEVLFYNSGAFNDIVARINAMVDLNIYSSTKGRALFAGNQGSLMDYTGFQFVFGAGVMLLYGFMGAKNRFFLRLLDRLVGTKRAYLYLLLSRFILMNLFFAFVLLLGCLLMSFQGILLSFNDCLHLAGYFGVWLVLSLGFLIIGFLIGTFQPNLTGIFTVMTVWFLFIYVFPAGKAMLTMEKANLIARNSHAELEKMNYMTDFEKRASRENAPINPKTASPELLEKVATSFMNNEYKKIQGVEKKIENDSRKTSDLTETISLLTFSTFYQTVANNISGKSYDQANAFFSYVQEMQHRFVIFYKHKEFDSADKKVENFIKGEENLFFAKSRMPSNIWAGIFITFLYITAFFELGYYRFRRYLCTPIPTEDNISPPLRGFLEELQLFRGQYKVLKVRYPRFIDYLYGLLAGRKSKQSQKYFTVENTVTLDGVDLSLNPSPMDFLSLPRPSDMPGKIKVANLLTFVTYALKVPAETQKELYTQLDYETIQDLPFGTLSSLKKVQVLLVIAQMKSYPIYMFHDIEKNTPMSVSIGVDQVMRKMVAQGSLVLLLNEEEAAVMDSETSTVYEWHDNTRVWKDKLPSKD